jgi:glutamine cyclotransferase
LKKLREYSYQGEGWGLAYDGMSLVMSDGSDVLTFRDPKTFKVTRTLRVTENGAPLWQINELECIGGEIWANVWHSERIVRIEAKTGRVTSYLDCRALFSPSPGGEDVLNGIAYDALTSRIFVTGKLWPKMFALRLKK